jgi:hypothetical protein
MPEASFIYREREDIMLATVKGNVKENTVVIDDEEIDNYMKEMREDRILPNP